MPEPHLRASDADRAAVADVLGRSMSSGRLTVAEYDDRLARAYGARTYGELAELTADLPATPPTTPAGPQPQAAPAAQWLPAGAGRGWAHAWAGGCGPWAGTAGSRPAWGSWLSTAIIVLGIWALTSVGGGGNYFWPIWVIGPWGLVLLARTLGGGAGPDRDRQRNRRAERHG